MLANRLKQLRLNNNLQQKDVANKIGISPVMISQYESGKREPSRETLSKLAKLYDVSMDYLLGLADNPITDLPKDFDSAYFKVMKDAKNAGLSPRDIELAIEFLKYAKQRDGE